MCDITGLSKMLKLEDLMSTGETGQNIPSLLKPNSYDGFFFFFGSSNWKQAKTQNHIK